MEPGPQQMGGFRIRHGFLQRFDETCSALHPDSSANQFERALTDFATMIGFASDRFDVNGEGPDVLWLFPNRVGFIIEAKSRKKDKNVWTKDQQGQLLLATECFKEHYQGQEYVRVRVMPCDLDSTTKATSRIGRVPHYRPLPLIGYRRSARSEEGHAEIHESGDPSEPCIETAQLSNPGRRLPCHLIGNKVN